VKTIASVGECMIELSEAGQGLMRRGFGGDTLNTAVYLRRELAPAEARVAYVTGLGDDPYSDELLAGWQAEGVDTSEVARLQGRLPGLYAIRTDANGERSFAYWRSEAAARSVFAGSEGSARLERLGNYDLVYFSGISLAILPAADRDRLLVRLAALRDGGRQIAFDPNFRPRLWPDLDEARATMTRAAGLATIVLPSFADEQTLFGDSEPGATLDRLHALGALEVIVKDGEAPMHFRVDGESFEALPVRVADPVDTTGAGDSFNAGYLAARLRGATMPQAVDAGSRLAARVVRHRGAIIPKDAPLY